MKKIDSTKVLAVFATTSLIFLIGLLIGNQISNAKLNQIQEIEEGIRVDTLSLEMQYLFLTEDPCRAINSTTLTQELYDVGSKLDFMENSLGQKNKKVISLKKYYSLLELRHWLFMNRAREQCGHDSKPILYFYSNLGDCPTCKEQGFVLDYLHKKYPHLNIYSFDINLDNPVIDSVKELYGIDSVPAMVIQDDLFLGFKDKEKMEALI